MPITKRSRFSHSETIARLMSSIVEAGNTVFATIDQAAAAEGAGLTLRPTTLIIFGNPKAGTALMDAFPLIALALPLKFIVWKGDAAVFVAYEPIAELASRYQVSGEEARLASIDAALGSLSDAVV